MSTAVASVVGVGLDLVDLARFRRVLARTPGIADRLFTAAELDRLSARADVERAMAGRFAAKEAVMKVLGAGIGEIGFTEIEVTSEGPPSVTLHRRAAERAHDLAIDTWHLSLTHDGPVAAAVAVAVR